MGGQLTPKIHWTKTNMQRFALLVIASVAAASPIEDTADVAAAKAEFNAAFARAEAGRHIELAPMNNDVQAALSPLHTSPTLMMSLLPRLSSRLLSTMWPLEVLLTCRSPPPSISCLLCPPLFTRTCTVCTTRTPTPLVPTTHTPPTPSMLPLLPLPTFLPLILCHTVASPSPPPALSSLPLSRRPLSRLSR